MFRCVQIEHVICGLLLGRVGDKDVIGTWNAAIQGVVCGAFALTTRFLLYWDMSLGFFPNSKNGQESKIQRRPDCQSQS